MITIEEVKTMNEIIVGRHIEGISLNDLEYLLDDNGEIMKFPTKEHAIRYLRAHGLSDEEISLHSFIYTNESKQCNCSLCEKRDDCHIREKFQRLPSRADGTGGLGMCPKL